jgi:hypothetical protein
MDPNAGPEFWQKVLAEGHPPLRFMHALFRYLPSPPRCKVCHNPFGGAPQELSESELASIRSAPIPPEGLEWY